MPTHHSHAKASLREAIDHIPQGIAVFDAGLRLVMSNARYNSLLDLPGALTKAGTPLFDIALFLGDRGDLGAGDAARLAIERINLLTASPTTVTQRMGNAGQTLEFHSSRLPDGGLVISFADVTAR
jgi:PAS domain-containing protein